MKVCTPKYTSKVPFLHLPQVQTFMFLDLNVELVLHFGEANNVKTLKNVSTVWRVSKDNDVVILAVAKKLWCVM